MKFEENTDKKAYPHCFSPPSEKMAIFEAQAVDSLNEAASILKELTTVYGEASSAGNWTFILERRTPPGHERLRYEHGKIYVWLSDANIPTIAFIVMFRDSHDAVQFKLTHC